MKSGLQKAALAKLAKLTQHDQLPPETRTQLRERLLNRCAEPKKLLSNGINGVNGLGGSTRIIAKTEFNSLLALMEMRIDETTAQSLFHIVGQHLSECCGYRFALGCSINADHLAISDLEDPPSRQLAYSLTTTLIRISTTLPSLEMQALTVFLDHLEKIGGAFSNAIAHQDVKELLLAIFTLNGSCEAATKTLSTSSSEFASRLISVIQPLVDGQLLIGIESLLSSLNSELTPRKSSSGSVRHPQDTQLHYLLRIRTRYILEGDPPGALVIQGHLLKLFEHVCYLTCPNAEKRPSFLPLHDFKERFSLLGNSTLRSISNLATTQLDSVEASADFLKFKTSPHQTLSLSLKATCLRLVCTAFVTDNGAPGTPSLVKSVLADSTQMSHVELGTACLDSVAVISMNCPEYTADLNRSLRSFIINTHTYHSSGLICIAAHRLAWCLKAISKDKVVSTLYSLVNVLAPGSTTSADRSTVSLRPRTALSMMQFDQHATASSISLNMQSDDQRQQVYSNVVEAIAEMVFELREEKIAELMISLLGQKFGRVNDGVDRSLIWGLAKIATVVKEKDLRRVLKLQAKARTEISHALTETVMDAHQYLAHSMEETSPYREILLTEILNALIEFWANESDSNYTQPNPLLPKYFATVAQVLPEPRFEGLPTYTDDTITAFRNMWFACVMHGVHPNNKWVQMNAKVLRKVAINSPLLTLESTTNDFDADLELNPVLNRMKEGRHHLRALEDELTRLLPAHLSEIKSFDHSKLVFVGAVTLVEMLRSENGKCSLVLDYFDDANLEKSDASGTMQGVVELCLKTFMGVLQVGSFDPQTTALGQRELRELLIRCCDVVPTVQNLAQKCCDRLISAFPELLCYEGTTYVLLELLTLLWEGCLSQETDLYSPKFQFRSNLTGTEIELRDSIDERRRLLDSYNHNARKWLLIALQKSPDDMRMVLQSYLAEFDESGHFSQNAPGRQLALEIGRAMPANDSRAVPLRNVGGLHVDLSSKFMADLAKRQRWRYAKAIIEGTSTLTEGLDRDNDAFTESKAKRNLLDRLSDIEVRAQQDKKIPEKELQENFIWAGTHLYASHEDEFFLVRKLVSIPFTIFTSGVIEFGVSIWVWISRARPSVHARLFAEIAKNWEWALRRRKGLFNPALNPINPFSRAMEYKPTDMQRRAKHERFVQEALAPHLLILRYIRQHLQPCGAVDTHIALSIYRLVITSLMATKETSAHPLAREGRIQLVLLGLQLVREGRLPQRMQSALQVATYKFALSWYAHPPMYILLLNLPEYSVTFGNNRIQTTTDYHLLTSVSFGLDRDPDTGEDIHDMKRLLQILLKDETFRVQTWLSPLAHDASVTPVTLDEGAWPGVVRSAWKLDPILAVHMSQRFASQSLHKEVRRLIVANPEDVIDCPVAAQIMLGDTLSSDLQFQLKYLLYWAPVVPPTAITYFLQSFGNNPLILQYAMRSLLSHSIQVTFFYVPQIVQALRYDQLGYVEQFIMEASLLSPLFAHQIIWNMNANAYKDEDSTIPDPLKPTLDHLKKRMTDALSGEDRNFYEREFTFFDAVTSISGKLKPYIKRSKPEKKTKIDEEMKKITLDVGVYLPSNPDGEVIGIDRKSGRPLQSHAKAPFMATFKIRRVRQLSIGEGKLLNGDVDEGEAVTEVMQSAIFKVGDDCRQDVLALQLISAFRNIFNSVGLDLYLFPYRVTATAPGCGVIDVLPNSISRDMLGREHVNGLYEFFMREHDGPNSTKFQKARNNFITSMAAYSIVTYLLQFKDRHNGNIMIDSEGHILHIDFGFCFDIAPGGITFESAPFKLTHEMITVISGPAASKQSQYYRRFEELCVKGFLACRPYADEIIRCVILMLDSGLPCFKGMTTIKNLRDRFVLDKTEREASDYMLSLIRASHENMRTVMYDQFQYATNGIPY